MTTAKKAYDNWKKAEAERVLAASVHNGNYSGTEKQAFYHMRDAAYAIGRRVGFDEPAESYMEKVIVRTLTFVENDGFPEDRKARPVIIGYAVENARRIAAEFRDMVKSRTLFEALERFERKVMEPVRDFSPTDRESARKVNRFKRAVEERDAAKAVNVISEKKNSSKSMNVSRFKEAVAEVI